MVHRPVLILAAALILSSAPLAAAGEPVWLTDYAKAREQATKESRMILADFTGSDWCGWCIKLKKEVFDTPEFKAWAEKNVVLLELDFPKTKDLAPETKAQNAELAKKFDIQGYPTIVFLSGAGEELGRTGYVRGGPLEWIKSLRLRVAEEAMDKASMTDEAGKEGEETEAGGWGESYAKALEAAKKSGRPVLADFTGSDWCGWCIKLKKEVFDTPEFKAWAAENVILLEVDYPRKKKLSDELRRQNEELSRKYPIEGYPTILFLDATGKKLGETGYVEGGPKAWIQEAESVLEQANK